MAKRATMADTIPIKGHGAVPERLAALPAKTATTVTVPLTFPAVMAIGAALGLSGVTLPWVEIGIAGSVMVLGAMVAVAWCRKR